MAAIAAPVAMSVDEYLKTSFEPDADYVDGWIEERALGEFDHARLQYVLARLLGNHEEQWEVYVTTELRMQVSPTRYRVPDVCVTDARESVEQVPERPPLLCIEVLSPEDRLAKVLLRAKDFHFMGVQQVWVFEPETGRVWISEAAQVVEWSGGLLRVPGTAIELDPAEAFLKARKRNVNP